MQGHTNFGTVTVVLFSEQSSVKPGSSKKCRRFYNHVVLELAGVLASLRCLTQLLSDFQTKKKVLILRLCVGATHDQPNSYKTGRKNLDNHQSF